MSAYEHGQNAANKGEHIRACPFDTGTPQWHEWRDGFMVGLAEYHARTLANMRYFGMAATLVALLAVNL